MSNRSGPSQMPSSSSIADRVQHVGTCLPRYKCAMVGSTDLQHGHRTLAMPRHARCLDGARPSSHGRHGLQPVVLCSQLDGGTRRSASSGCRASPARVSSISRLTLAQFVNPQSFAVLGTNGSFRESATASTLNPTNTSPPFFQVFHPDFVTKILGQSASIRVVASNPGFAFAHEAPIWVPATDEVFFASNGGGALGFSDIDHNNQVAKISLDEVTRAADASRSKTTPLNVTVTAVRSALFDLAAR